MLKLIGLVVTGAELVIGTKMQALDGNRVPVVGSRWRLKKDETLPDQLEEGDDPEDFDEWKGKELPEPGPSGPYFQIAEGPEVFSYPEEVAEIVKADKEHNLSVVDFKFVNIQKDPMAGGRKDADGRTIYHMLAAVFRRKFKPEPGSPSSPPATPKAAPSSESGGTHGSSFVQPAKSFLAKSFLGSDAPSYEKATSLLTRKRREEEAAAQ